SKSVQHEQIHGVNYVNGRDGVTEPPAGHRKTLGKAINDDRALSHSGEGANGLVLAFKENARVNFIGNDPEIVFQRKFGDFFKGCGAKYRSGWVVRGIEDDDACARRDFRGDFAEIRLKVVLFFQPKRHRLGAQAAREGRIDWKAGI